MVKREEERFLVISSEYLSEKVGCGAILKNIPVFREIIGLWQAFKNYGIEEVRADKQSQKILQKEEIVGPFCSNALVNKIPLKPNFKTSFLNQDIYLIVDEYKKIAYFISEPANKLAIVNYYRDAVPNLAKKLNIFIRGALSKLNPKGYKNLYELLNSEIIPLLKEKNIKNIEIISAGVGISIVNHSLRLETGLVNFSDTPKLIAEIKKNLV
ncbi:MAG: hypothetical protein N2323_04020 [candidate division WOR-3 bacterium]|nr:hypothetical protein [candidate division WOR-3 bacterium]MCX7837108.1 hypothetical protein [candidate division WOR-3 bacterium]MDW8113982.1 hypothetical protein [candidate division WOR-3 bacterium]